MEPVKEVHTVERITIAVPMQNPNDETPFDPKKSPNKQTYSADDQQKFKIMLFNLACMLQQTVDSLHDLVAAVRSDLGAEVLMEVQPQLAKAHSILAKTLQSATQEKPRVIK